MLWNTGHPPYINTQNWLRPSPCCPCKVANARWVADAAIPASRLAVASGHTGAFFVCNWMIILQTDVKMSYLVSSILSKRKICSVFYIVFHNNHDFHFKGWWWLLIYDELKFFKLCKLLPSLSESTNMCLREVA
jgi:hypothetical protein